MAEKTNSQLPTIDIKGKQYVLVKDRLLYFNETYPNGSIRTQRVIDENREVVKATVFPDVSNMERYFTGYSQAVWWDWYINKTSALENCESSAVWRALAMMGIWILEWDSIASADEVKKAEATEKILEKAENEKPWFNDKEFEWLKQSIDYVKKFEHSKLLLDDLGLKYKISKAMAAKIADFWASVE